MDNIIHIYDKWRKNLKESGELWIKRQENDNFKLNCGMYEVGCKQNKVKNCLLDSF